MPITTQDAHPVNCQWLRPGVVETSLQCRGREELFREPKQNSGNAETLIFFFIAVSVIAVTLVERWLRHQDDS